MEISKATKLEVIPESQCIHFSKLPDELIHDILEKLPLEETMKTGSLSQRWRNLWKYRTNIKIGPSWVESTGKEVFPSVNHFISLHMGEKIKEFSVKFMYQPDMSAHVDSWIQFAKDKKVENLEMDLDVNYGEMRSTTRNMPSYVLNPCLFDCDSLVTLKLRCCIMKLPTSTSLRNLKEIYLQQMDLDNTMVYTLTSNTPVLEVLSMEDCNTHSDLHINVAPNPHFRRLSIHEGLIVDPHTRMHLTAPTAKEFLFDSGLVPRTSYNINVSRQCTKVALLLDIFFRWCAELVMQEAGVEVEEQGEDNNLTSNWVTWEMEQKLLNMLGCFREVKSLAISNWGVQILSIRERRNIGRIAFNCKYLKLYTNFRKWELPGICYMLKACNELEEIIFVTPSSDEEEEPINLYWVHGDLDEGQYFDHMKSILKLPKLKTMVVDNKHRDEVAEVEEVVYNLMVLLSVVAENLQRYVMYRNKERYELHMAGIQGCQCSVCSYNSGPDE